MFSSRVLNGLGLCSVAAISSVEDSEASVDSDFFSVLHPKKMIVKAANATNINMFDFFIKLLFLGFRR
jgi:hypothetical protein